MTDGTTAASCTGARDTKAAPPAKASRERPATSRASRVLPTPPGPVRVSSRTSSRVRRLATAATSYVAPDERRRGRGKDAPVRLRLAAGGGTTGGRLELGEVSPFEPKGFGQLLHGVPVWAAPLPALEQANGLGGQVRQASQILLGEAGRIALAPE